MSPESPISQQEKASSSDVQRAITRFFDSGRFQNLSDNTQISYRGDLKDFRNFLEQDILAHTSIISREVILAYLQQYQKHPATATRRLAAIRAFFNWATDQKTITQNPTEGIPSPHVEKVKKNPLRYLEKNAADRLMARIENIRDKALITIAIKTGANSTEISALDVKNVFTIPNKRVAIRFIKSLGQERSNELDEETSKVIMNLLILREKGPLFIGNHTQREDRITRQGIWSILKKYDRNLSARILRDTFVMNFPGYDSKMLARHLGISHHQASILLSRRKLTPIS